MNQTDRILKKELSLSKRAISGLAVGMALFYAFSIVFCVFIYSTTRNIVSSQAIRSITNISQLNKDSVSLALKNRRTLLETLSAHLERRQLMDREEILEELTDFGNSYNFHKMGYLDKDEKVYLTDGAVIDASQKQMAKEIWDDKFHITESQKPYMGGEHMINIFSCPVFEKGEIQYVLVATYYSKNLTERMNISSMEGKGYTFLLNSKGEAAIHLREYEDEEYKALMEYVSHTPETISKTSGNSFFTYEGQRYFAHFEELGINNWLLMTCVKEADVFADAHAITEVVYLMVGALWLTILFAVAYHFSYVRRIRVKRTRETFYDQLLNIPNKNALSVIYEKMPRQLLNEMYLMIFDIDKFKAFNYIHGSEAGDRLLKYIVQALYEAEPNIYLFRYISDCFVVLDKNRTYQEYEEKIKAGLERFKRDIEAGVIPPFDISAGIRKVRAEDSLQRVVSDALVARDTVKGNHICSYAFYDEEIRNRRLAYMEMETDFSAAIRNKEFQVYYQPKFDMRTGEIVGAEALARWIKADGRIVSPGVFIPCLEASRQIITLDEEILSQVCRQMKDMEEQGLDVRQVSVNLSRVHLRNPGILSKIEAIISQFGVDPSRLSFEITETVLYEDSIPLKTIVDKLHALGCQVELDDYGVGVSGPNSLAKNNFDVVKLDKSLTDGLGNERVEDVIRSTAHMAGKWGIQVTVEGVEEERQVERLVELGCSWAQGFYYAKPLPEKEYRALLASSKGSSRRAPKVPMTVRYFPDEVCAVLDGNLLPTYIIDPEHFAVMYCNPSLRRQVPEDPTGGLCYKKMRNQEAPCEDCPAMRLYRDGDDTPEEIQNIYGNWLLIQTSPLRWQGREFVQITFVDISKQKQMEAELLLRSREYEVILQKSVTGIMRYDLASDTATVNVDDSLNRTEEYTVSNCIRAAREGGMIDSESLPVAAAMMEDIRSGAPSQGYDIQIRPRKGEPCWCRFDYTLLNDHKGQPYRAVISFYDNTQQREKELAYKSWNDSLRALMDQDTIYVGVNLSQDRVEAENRFGSWNQESVGRRFGDFIKVIARGWVAPEHIQEFYDFFKRERLLGLYYGGQREDSLEYLAMKEGHPQWFRVGVQMASEPSSNCVKASLLFHYVDGEVRERERLLREAERDSLTGIYNRATTERRIREVLEQHTGERCCFLLIDLDDLRGINSSLGHPEGDKAIKGIADTMRAKFRKEDVLGRIGGDEFVAFLRNVPEAGGLKASVFDFMCRIREMRIGPCNDRPVHVSVGGAIGIAGKDGFKTIYEQADLALYYTKANGKNGFHFYVPEMEDREFLYQPRSLETETNWYEAMEIRRLVKAMAPFFPLVFSANLTKNTYCMMEYEPYIEERVEDEGIFDHLVEVGANAFHPEDREDFLACCHRKSLLQAYSEGRRIIGHKGRQRGADGIYRMVQTVVLFIQERDSGDVCQLTFAHVMNRAEGAAKKGDSPDT